MTRRITAAVTMMLSLGLLAACEDDGAAEVEVEDPAVVVEEPAVTE